MNNTMNTKIEKEWAFMFEGGAVLILTRYILNYARRI